MSLRGVHINTLDNGAMSLLQQARPALVKTLDFGPDWAALKADCDIRFLLGRVWCDDDAAMMPTPERAAERLGASQSTRWSPTATSWHHRGGA